MMNATGANDSIKHQNGYDIPLVGLDTGDFDQLHITALCCIFVSCVSALVVLCMSCTEKRHKVVGFFQWRQISRFVVYMAICDCSFNVIHSMDHFHVFFTRNHPKPRELCQFYAFLLVEFVGAQVLMVNLVAINMFVLIFFNKRINFGRFDWKLLVWMFGYPFAANIVAVCTESLGPNGSFCFYDGVNGNIMQLAMITVPQGLIVVMNSLLYFLTWLKIRQQQPQLKAQRGYEKRVTRRAHKAAKNMILLVVMFLIQWCAPSIYGLWRALGYSVPLYLLQCVIVSANIGGVLNGIVFLILRHNQVNSRRESTTYTHRSSDSTSKGSTMAFVAAATAAAAAVTASTVKAIKAIGEEQTADTEGMNSPTGQEVLSCSTLTPAEGAGAISTEASEVELPPVRDVASTQVAEMVSIDDSELILHTTTEQTTDAQSSVTDVTTAENTAVDATLFPEMENVSSISRAVTSAGGISNIFTNVK